MISFVMAVSPHQQ